VTDPATGKKIAAYLTAFESEARRVKLAEWSDISKDVRGHINEAVEYGRPLEDVLKAMGRPEALARAYALELMLQRPKSSRGHWGVQALRLAGLAAVGGVVTLVVVMALGSIGAVLVFSGMVFLATGLLEAAGVHFAFVSMGGLSPWVFVAASPPMFAIGVGALWLLAKYLRYAAGQLVRSIPTQQPA